MRTQHIAHDTIFRTVAPMIDGEFDLFELNDDLKIQLCEAETANFYHNAINEGE